MALTLEALQSRMSSEFALFGLASGGEQGDVLRDALARYISKMDRPILSETMAVVAGTLVGDIPDEIQKIQDVRDSAGESVAYTVDETVRQVVLQTAPAVSTSYTVYGTPRQVATDIEAILAAMEEDQEGVLWGFVTAFAHRKAKSQEYVRMLREADLEATYARRQRNRALNMDGTMVPLRDQRNRTIGDSSPGDGGISDISTTFEADL